MYRRILFVIIGGLLLWACKDDCEENAPLPLSFLLQWQNAKGEDAYTANLFHPDSLVAYYKYNHKVENFKLQVNLAKEDSTLHFIDLMPMARKMYEINIDTLFIGNQRSDIDTIYMNLVNVPSECFSTLYKFEKLTYNGNTMVEKDGYYRIKK